MKFWSRSESRQSYNPWHVWNLLKDQIDSLWSLNQLSRYCTNHRYQFSTWGLWLMSKSCLSLKLNFLMFSMVSYELKRSRSYRKSHTNQPKPTRYPTSTDRYRSCQYHCSRWLPATDNLTIGLLESPRSHPCPWSAQPWPESAGTNPTFYQVCTIIDVPVWSNDLYSNKTNGSWQVDPTCQLVDLIKMISAHLKVHVPYIQSSVRSLMIQYIRWGPKA